MTGPSCVAEFALKMAVLPNAKRLQWGQRGCSCGLRERHGPVELLLLSDEPMLDRDFGFSWPAGGSMNLLAAWSFTRCMLDDSERSSVIMPAARRADSSLGRIPSNKDQLCMDSSCGISKGDIPACVFPSSGERVIMMSMSPHVALPLLMSSATSTAHNHV